MEAVAIIGAIAAIAIVGGISFVVDRYSWGTYDYRPFNPQTIWGSFVCGLLVALGACLLGTGFTTIALFVLVCGVLVYIVLLVIVWQESNLLIAFLTVTILSALFAVVAPLRAVWFVLKPKQKSSVSRTRLSDTTDEDDDDDEHDDELEPLADPSGRLENLWDQINALEHQPAIGPDDLGDLRDQIDELVDALNIGEPVHQIYINELERMRGRIEDLEDRWPLC